MLSSVPRPARCSSADFHQRYGWGALRPGDGRRYHHAFRGLWVAIILLLVYTSSYRCNLPETFRPTPWLQRFSSDRIVGYETNKWFFRRRC